MKLVWSAKFIRAAKKLARTRKEMFDAVEATLRLLEEDPYHPKLRTHKLSGELEGCLACSVSYDLRIVFELDRARKGADMEIHLLNIGTHNEVY